jgi:hypothetical protein
MKHQIEKIHGSLLVSTCFQRFINPRLLVEKRQAQEVVAFGNVAGLASSANRKIDEISLS